jgi:hypothetical protein
MAESLCVKGRKVAKTATRTHAGLQEVCREIPKQAQEWKQRTSQKQISLPLNFMIILKLCVGAFPLILIESSPMTFVIPKSSINSLQLVFFPP